MSYINYKIAKHRKPINDIELEYYLAGLIEGDGYFGDRRLEIIFNEMDTPLAGYLQQRIGYGSVSKIKGKKEVKYGSSPVQHPSGSSCQHADLVRARNLPSACALRVPGLWLRHRAAWLISTTLWVPEGRSGARLHPAQTGVSARPKVVRVRTGCSLR